MSSADSPAAETVSPPAGLPVRIGRFAARRLRFICMALPLGVLAQLPDGWWWVLDLSQHFTFLFLCGGAVLTLIALCARWWREAAVAGLSSACWLVPLLPWWLPDKTPAPSGPPLATLDVLSCNLLLECRDPAAAREALGKADPDVLLLLEFTPQWQIELAPVLDRYPHQIGEANWNAFGIWFGSKFEIDDSRIVNSESFPCIAARLELPGGGKIGIVGVHPVPPTGSEFAEIHREMMLSFPSILDETGAGARILMGDFNCAPFARPFRRLLESARLRDTSVGRGLASTWSPVSFFFPGLPLDHILISDRLRVVSRSLGPPIGSDHRWVQAVLEVR